MKSYTLRYSELSPELAALAAEKVKRLGWPGDLNDSFLFIVVDGQITSVCMLQAVTI